MTDRLFAAYFGSPALAAVLGDALLVQRVLDFEAALARAEARVGVIPGSAVAPIAAACRADLYNIAALADATALAGNPAIPLVKALTARVKAADADAARFVHWGATSQDAMDTALVLQLRAALAVLDADLAALAATCRSLAEQHRHTVMVGRTWLQQALPITFGLKAAGWYGAVVRHRQRLAELRPRLLALQFGGAVGTLAALGGQGVAVAEALAEELDLALPELPWHGQRDRVVELATLCGLITGSLGKIARDVSLLMQTEIGEAFEPAAAGKGGSSTMPHKRNPVGAAAVLSAANRVPALVAGLLAGMVQEHERGLGGWHAEWQALPEALSLTGGALSQLNTLLAGLDIDATRMRANLDVTHGLIMAEAVTMALGEALGRLAAHQLVEAACHRALAEGRHLREVLAEQPEVRERLSAKRLAELFDPAGYLGATQTFIDRALAQ
jgi:3-carboxy-cis,cis-muconate cycloisomerase